MYPISYWEKSAFFSDIDILIIGSGIVGLSSAIYLKRNAPNLNVVIVERGSLPSGASTKNAGFACFGSMTELIDDLKTRSEDEVFGLVKKRWEGLTKLRKLLIDKAIGYQHFGGYELFSPKDEDIFQECHSSIDHFNLILKEITGQKDVFQIKSSLLSKFGFKKVKHLIFNKAEGQINTGSMMKSLIAKARELNIEILNGLEVKQINECGGKVEIQLSSEVSFQVKRVIVATNGFASQLLEGLDLKPARNQVIITETISDLPFRGCFHIDRGYYYFRSIDCNNGKSKRILLGGGRNLSPEEETTSEFGQTKIIQSRLAEILHESIFPKRKLKIEMRWSGILGIGQTKNPIIKKVSPSIITAVRLGGMGVAIGCLTGETVAKKIMDEI